MSDSNGELEEQSSTKLPIKSVVQRSPERTKGKRYRDGVQCVRIKANGERCQKAPILGGTVCRFHGGAAKHVKLAAQARLDNAADRLAKQLLRMVDDETLKPEVRLAAMKEALNRGLGTPRQTVDLTHEIPLWQKVAQGVASGGVYRGPRREPSIVDGTYGAPTVVDGEIVPSDSAEFGDGREP